MNKPSQVIRPDDAILKALELGLITVDVNAGVVYDQQGNTIEPQYPENKAGYAILYPFPTPPGTTVIRAIYLHRVVAFAFYGRAVRGKKIGHLGQGRAHNGIRNLIMMDCKQFQKKFTDNMRVAWRFVTERGELVLVVYSDAAAIVIAERFPRLYVEESITRATRNHKRQRWLAKQWAFEHTGHAGGISPLESIQE